MGGHRVEGTLCGGTLCRGSDITHVDATLQPHVAVLTPTGAPAVLNEPVVNAALTTIANHGDGVVKPGAVGIATGKDSPAVSAEGSPRDHSANHCAVLIHHLLQELLVALMSYVGPRNNSTLKIDSKV